MPTIKTAISIDTDIFKKVERMSKQLHISRSQFFSQAALHMLEKKENLELIQKINAAYSTIYKNNDEKIQRKQEKRYHSKRITEQW